jgi:aspartate racemase
MKTIGLLGGMSWESTMEYYRILNETVKIELGGLHSMKCLIHSVDFAEIESLQHSGDWNKAGQILCGAALGLQLAGADMILICTNSMHILYQEIQSQLKIPVIHIADATAEMILRKAIHRVGLLGTRFTMQGDFYKGRLESKYGLEVLVPEVGQQDELHRMIYQELCLGTILEQSRVTVQKMIEDLKQRGSQGIILGCTEIGLLIKQKDSILPVFDTTQIHAEHAVRLALSRDDL